MSDEICLAEYFITNDFEITNFIVIYRNEDNSVRRKKISSDFKARIYHIKPVGVKATVGFSITLHWVKNLVTILVKETAISFKFFSTLCEIVVIDEVIAGIVWRVNIYHLDFTKIVLTQNFQYIKIITLNVKILGSPEIL